MMMIMMMMMIIIIIIIIIIKNRCKTLYSRNVFYQVHNGKYAA